MSSGAGSADCRNIEIKAKLNEAEFNEKLEIAKKLTGKSNAEILKQMDIFFQVKDGRLKLRYENDSECGRLVQYSRENVKGPKLSNFNILDVTDGKLLEKILADSIGVLGVLEKTRYLFIHNRTRIHLDIVSNKDSKFYGMEFEVMMEPGEDLNVGNLIAEEFMNTFELQKEQLLEGSYFEILNSEA